MTAALAQRELGRTGLEVSVLGFGGAGIGNLYRPLDDEDALAAVRESFASGVRYFDTAPPYHRPTKAFNPPSTTHTGLT